MKVISIEDIRSWNPCYEPVIYFPEDWKGTALDILKMDNSPANFRLASVLREDVLDAKTIRLFGVWCARQALALIDNPDPRSIAACDVAERYAHGEASEEELRIANKDAQEAGVDASNASANNAYALAYRHASDAAWAARHATWTDAQWAARDAAAAARYAASREAQVQHLIEMIES